MNTTEEILIQLITESLKVQNLLLMQLNDAATVLTTTNKKILEGKAILNDILDQADCHASPEDGCHHCVLRAELNK